MPRVGKSVYDSAPLWTSIKSTPSRSPPRKVRLRIDQSCGVASRRLSLPAEKLSSQTSLATSVRTQDLKRVMRMKLRPPGGMLSPPNRRIALSDKLALSRKHGTHQRPTH